MAKKRSAWLVAAAIMTSACSHGVPVPAPVAVEPTVRPPESATVESPPTPPAPPRPLALEAHDAAIDAPLRRDAPRMTVEKVTDVLFLPGETHPACADGEDDARARCLIAARFAADPRAAAVATDLFDRTRDVAGLSRAETMEGGWRGTLHLVPELPIANARTHLEWVADATRDYDLFFHALHEARDVAPRYVWRGVAFRFMRSVAANRPSAYATDWSIAYNLAGSLNTSKDAVRELLFHEGFHLNDEDHGDWSARTLRDLFDGIVAKCGTRIPCLTPFAPTETTVRGGTYYAFQPNNGDAVHEYAAELAVRYYREQRAALMGLPRPRRFKCGPPASARAWTLLVEEFFAGIDRTPACGG